MIYLLNERYDALRYTRQIKRDANALTAIIGRRRCRHPQTRLRLVGWFPHPIAIVERTIFPRDPEWRQVPRWDTQDKWRGTGTGDSRVLNDARMMVLSDNPLPRTALPFSISTVLSASG